MSKKRKLNKWALASVILGILLIGSLVYLGVSGYKKAADNKKNEVFLQGAQYGYQSAIGQLIESGANCQPVDVYFGNETKQFVDVDCLN